ncbi:hypothetical protein [Mycobacterium avium]|uniref:hypothetical protein n=1 Tax=Mycobacterium avium TaxID=1764 RepID=UPI0007A0DBE1|nr:hypothetical protein [Mycobacterium avium]
MNYWATFGVAITSDEPLDPIELARRGYARVQELEGGTWKITDLSTGEIQVVDLTDNRIIKPEEEPRQT